MFMRFGGCIVIVFIILAAEIGRAQNYIIETATGAQEYTANIRPNGRLILKGPAEDTLSAWQALPFPWKFYGTDVSRYCVSDNGYLTFDTTALLSMPDNAGAADAGGPNNAIYAFWDDLHFLGGQPQWSNEVRTITIGTSPNRAHVIMWIGAVPPGLDPQYGSLSFAIALKEQGDFEIVQIAGKSTLRMTGSIGAENADGGMAAFVEGSPQLNYPSLGPSPDDDISYRFRFVTAQYDLALFSVNTPKSVLVNQPVAIQATVQNMGMQPLQSFDMFYSIDGGAEQAMTVSGIDLQSGQKLDVTHSVPWTPTQAGLQSLLTLRVANLNGGVTDEDRWNDTAREAPLCILGRTTGRHILVEEFTGAWCGWCPDGALMVEELERLHPNLIPVAIHAGGTDSMIIPLGEAFDAAFQPSYPTIMVDRFKFPDEARVPVGRTDGNWFDRVNARATVESPLYLEITPSYAEATRTAGIDVAVTAVDYLPYGYYPLHVWLTETPVSGTGRGYDQVNYFSGNATFPTHPYYDDPNPMPGFAHRRVLRASLTGDWGDETIVPRTPQADGVYTAHFDYTLPSHINPENVTVVAFVTRRSWTVEDSPVLNCMAADLAKPNAVETIAPQDFRLSVSPNPAASQAIVRYRLDVAAEVDIALYSLLGVRIDHRSISKTASGDYTASFDLRSIPPGVYMVVMTADSKRAVRALTVVK